jgi:hypothetical protein
MRAQHIFVIPDQTGLTGGKLYDRFGNLTFFANTSSLDDVTATATDKSSTVKAHSRGRFMRDPAKSSVSSFGRIFSSGIRQSKGGYPGYTVTLVSDEGLPGEERREFSYTGTMSALYAWLKTTAKLQVNLYGPTGAPYNAIPAHTP